MIVRVYNFLSAEKPKFSQNLVGIVSDVESFKYTRRAYDIGSFEMVVPTHADEAGCIQPDRMLIVGEKLGQTYIASDPTKRIVKGTFLYVTDIEKKDDKITVTGYDLKYLFALRVTLFPKEEQDKGTYGYYVTSGTTFSCISDIINYNIVNATDSDRQIYGMFSITMPVNQTSADPPLTGIQDDRYMTRLEPVSTAIFNLLKNCKTHFYDMRLIIDDNAEDGDNYNPHMESSEDKPTIIIDESRYNIKSYTRKDGTSAYKNAIYAVVGSGDDVTVKCVKRPNDTASGVKRKEVVLDVDTDSVAEIDRYALKAAEEYVISDDFEIEPLFMDDEAEPELAQKVSIRIDGVEYETVITEITDEYANGKHTQSYVCGDKKLKVLNVLNKATAGNTQKIINNKITAGNAGGVGEYTNTDKNCEIFNDYENNVAGAYYSHAEGYQTTASAPYCHSEGSDTIASAPSCHTEGAETKATNNCCHAEGYNTEASGGYSHAEGRNTKATGWTAHAEGESTVADGMYSHAEGYTTIAISPYSHAGGFNSESRAESSFAHGNYVITKYRYGTVFGSCNKTQDALFVVGNGEVYHRSDALTLSANGELWVSGSIKSDGTSLSGMKGISVKGSARFGEHWTTDSTSVLLAVGNGYDNERLSDALTLDNEGNLTISGKFSSANGYDFSNAIASSTALGAIKIGENLSISEDGTLSAGGGSGYVLPTATADTLGGVRIGDNITVTDDGTISVDLSSYLKSAEIADWAKQPEKPVYTADEVGAAAEQHKHSTADITDFPAIPTKVSDLQNDSGYISEETDPTVPAWAKAESKPAYTAEEVGAAAKSHTHTKSQITDFPESLPANGGTADVAKKLTDWGTTYVTDADNAPLGLSRISNEGKNNPYTFWATLLTLGADDTDGYRQQWAFPWGWGEAPGKPKYRVKDNGTWFAWQSLPDGGNADTVDGKHASDFATAEDVSSAVSAVQIGGRNLLLGTGEISVIEGTNTADQCLAHHDLACGSIVNLEPGVYTCSADIIGTVEGGTAHMQFYGPPWETIPEMSGNVTVKTTKQKIGGTFTLSSPQTFSATGMRVRTDYVSGTITVSNMKLEKGNKPTDWTPAPEDDERRIASLEARVAALEAAAVSGGEV